MATRIKHQLFIFIRFLQHIYLKLRTYIIYHYQYCIILIIISFYKTLFPDVFLQSLLISSLLLFSFTFSKALLYY